MAGKSFSNRSVFITGAGSGIGFEVALAFARKGPTSLPPMWCRRGWTACGGSRKSSAWDIRMRCWTCPTRRPSRPWSGTGRPGHVAGYRGEQRRHRLPDYFSGHHPEQWRRTLDINVLGVAWGSSGLPAAVAGRGIAGHLVNIASAASVTPMPNMAAYAASKYAVEGCARCCRWNWPGRPSGSAACIRGDQYGHRQTRRPHGLSREQTERLQRHYAEKGAHPSVVARDILAGSSRASPIFSPARYGPAAAH